MVVLVVLPAHAWAATPPKSIARALARSPLFVDPAFDGARPAAQRASLLRALRAASRPVYVAFVPIVAGDEYDGDAHDFLAVLHDQLGRDGIYVTVSDGLLVHREYGGTYDQYLVVSAASSVTSREAPSDEAPLAYVRRFVDALEDPDIVKRANPQPDTPAKAPDDGGGADATGLILGIIGAVLLLAIVVAVLRAGRGRRGGAHYAEQPLPVLPRHVFENARAAAQEDLREQARAAVIDFAAALDPVSPPAGPAAAREYDVALDASATASRVLEHAHTVPDLVGVLALIDRGYAALAAAQALAAGRSPAPAQPLCFFNPLHGRAQRRVAWSDGPHVPACGECAKAVKRGDPPDALRDGRRPYMECDTVWAHTGYGAFADDLVGRVARGER
jgi:hypothetical protein